MHYYPRTLHKGGYQIISASRVDERFPWDDDRFIVPKEEGFITARQLAERTRSYDPMDAEHSTAYIDFAELAGGDVVAIIDFINRHGRLTSPEHWIQIQDVADEARKPVMGEPLAFWTVGARRLKLALDLLSATERGDVHFLAERIRPEAPEPPFKSPPGLTLFHNDDIPETFAPDDEVATLSLADRGRYFVAALIRAQLIGSVHPVVTFSPKYGVETQPAAPTSLLAALWLRFSHELQGVDRIRFCVCGSVVPSKRGTRRDKRFCSPTCKVKNSPSYRAKHKTVR